MLKNKFLLSIILLPLLATSCSCGHTHTVVIDKAIEATCESIGLTEGSHCSECNAVLVKQNVIDKLDHTVVTDAKVEATCTSTGLTEGSHCSVCNKVLVKQEIIPMKEHTVVADAKVEATCISTGLTEGSHCSECDTVIKAQEVISKNNHTKGNLISIYENVAGDIEKAGSFMCTSCNIQYCDTITENDISIPMLELNGDFNGISKETKVKLQCKYSSNYVSFSSDCTLKLQGGSSIGYPKKNYNIQFFKSDTDYKTKNKVTLQEGWSKESKYTLKANYIDFTQARNVVSGKIYGDIVKSRNIEDQLNDLVNGGAIDGFPIIIYQNGVFNGLYTLNLAKEDYLFGMEGDEDTNEAILMCDDWTSQGALKQAVDETLTGFDLEYCSTNDTSWVQNSFNNFISFLNNSTDEELKNNISTYTDVNRAIDQMLYTIFIRAYDNTSKNILWATYDGIRWYPSVYDMDGTWGTYWNGEATDYSSIWTPFTSNKLWERIWNNYKDAIKERYFELRSNVLSSASMNDKFTTFFSQIPSIVKEAESRKWPNVPNKTGNTPSQITDYIIKYPLLLDSYFNNL